ncbi:hypothetical protein CLV94_2641 [Flavobacterium endophyticum]|uniref:Uncharacterized protein n=1 Tax=Flavobacterium endophyticum TaxID=1540163 RepID=A0A495M7K4_9FLAO|nr:hypothetical protein [Flavobacterium endophyticum]RKS22004.1 hypothetical protein CLV94_2641 [Flavobacterium endophyticum]
MKKLLLLTMILVWQTHFCQTVLIYTAKKDFIPAEIKLTNGEIITGYIKEFNVPNAVEFPEFSFSTNLESELRLDRTKFNFKKTLESTSEKIDLSTIQSITLKSEDTITYEKLKLKTINSKLELVDLKREIMAPLIKEGKINVYGLRVYECSPGCTLMWILTYVKKPNDEFAFVPVDYNRVNLLNLGKIDDKFFRAFEEVGKDCSEFLSYVAEKKAEYNGKGYGKKRLADFKEHEKDKKEKLKQIENNRERRKMADDMDTEYNLKFYLDVIKEYSSRCK